MAGGSSVAKVQQWAGRLERFRNSGQSVTKFCEAEGVSQPSFYQWKKKLAFSTGRAREATPFGKALLGKAFQAVELKPVTRSTTTTTTIRLPNGVEIELGNDPRVIELVLQQLLRRSADSASGWTC